MCWKIIKLNRDACRYCYISSYDFYGRVNNCHNYLLSSNPIGSLFLPLCSYLILYRSGHGVHWSNTKDVGTGVVFPQITQNIMSQSCTVNVLHTLQTNAYNMQNTTNALISNNNLRPNLWTNGQVRVGNLTEEKRSKQCMFIAIYWQLTIGLM